MKILHIVRQFYPSIGGVENFVYNLAKHQILSGDDVSILTLNRSFQNNRMLASEEIYDGIKINRIGFWGCKRYAIAPSCISRLSGFDIIHIHCVDFFVDYLSFLKPFHKKKMVLHTHGGFFHTKWLLMLKRLYFYTITRMALMGCDRIIACSENDRELFSAISNNVVLVDNGVDVEKYSTIQKNIEYGSLVYIGRIAENKRVDALIRATACLVRKGLAVTLKIIGEDYSGTIPQLRSIAAGMGIADRVVFLGRVNDADLVNEMSKAHVFVSASEYEAFGISAVEAMASGTVCVLSDIPSFKKFVDSEAIGIITDYKDCEGAAAAIARVLCMNAENYIRIGMAARQRASLYNWNKVEKKVRSVYREILECV